MYVEQRFCLILMKESVADLPKSETVGILTNTKDKRKCTKEANEN